MNVWEFVFRLIMILIGDYLDLLVLVLFIGVLFLVILWPISLLCLDLLTKKISRIYKVAFFSSLLVASLIGVHRYYTEMPWDYITQWGWRDQLTVYQGIESSHLLEPVHYNVRFGVSMDNYLTESVLNPVDKFATEDSKGLILMVVQGIFLILDLPALLLRGILWLGWSIVLILYFYASPFLVKLLVSLGLLVKSCSSSLA